MNDVQYLRPRSLDDALRWRRDHPDYLVVAGCTDVMVGARDREPPPGMLDLFGLAPLCGVAISDSDIRIGAATTYAEILRADAVRRSLPCLWSCVNEIGAVQIQARGTIGGNIATSSPVGDTLPALLAIDATIHLASATGERTIPYRDFCTGYRQTVLADDELIVAIQIPLPAPATQQYWRKVGTRRAQAISKVSVAAVATLRGGTIASCRLAMGAVADRPIRVTPVENLLTGTAPTAALADAADKLVQETIQPIDDVRSSAAYRRMVAGRLTRRFILSLV